MGQHTTLRVRHKETGDVMVVNTTPGQVLDELKKPAHQRNRYVMLDAHEPYFDPSIHEEIAEDAKDKKKAATRTRTKPAAATATPAAPEEELEDEDEEEEDDDEEDEDEDD